MRASGVFVVFAVGSLVVVALGHGLGCQPGNGATSDSGPPSDAAAAPDGRRVPYPGLGRPEAGPRTPVHAEFTSTPIRTDTMQLMFAAGEMQTSGEPFASNFAGRDLNYFVSSRYLLPPDQYVFPCTNCQGGFYRSVIDLFGFSTAVESYEYSKYHMNMVANQTGAGVSLINGPLIAARPGASAFDKLQARMEALIAAAGADVAVCAVAGTQCSSYAQIPPPANNPLNDFGFPGLWPNLAPYRTFDVSSTPERIVVASCTSARGYGGVLQYGNNAVFRYECDYSSLRLNDPEAQSEHVIGPGIVGYATWKEALWAIDFTGRLHDSQASAVTAVAPKDLVLIGRHGNQVKPVAPPRAVPGVFIGSTPLEGMWGLTMIEEMDNAAAMLLSSLATADGTTLTGLPSVLAAIQYDDTSPLVWFPTAVGVTIVPRGAGGRADRYPQVAAFTVQDATSRSVDLAALAQGYSLLFAMTDARNAAVGQQIGMQVAFGGSVFAADDGLPDGENTPHDRALGVMRVAFIDLDRMHVDPATGVVVDTAAVTSGGLARGTSVTTTALGHVVVGLRHLLMACNAAVTQYGAPDSDVSADALGILNAAPIASPAPDAEAPPSFSARVRAVLLQQARFVLETLSGPDGTVRNGATLAAGQWSAGGDPATLEAQSSALRVLVEAWFLTHDASYRDRAQKVATTLLTAFWSETAQMFRGRSGGADEVLMTPERFGWLQQALRETHEALWVPGDPLLDRAVLEDRMARTNKLYLNGWDDLNADQRVDISSECLGARMQLGEQALTGEIGENSNGMPYSRGPDRDSDCVVNIAYSLDGGSTGGTSSVLAGEVRFHAP